MRVQEQVWLEIKDLEYVQQIIENVALKKLVRIKTNKKSPKEIQILYYSLLRIA